MPTYLPPTFNNFLDVWLPPATPAANPPTFTAIQCQTYVFSRTPQLYLHPPSGKYLPLIIIRLPFAFAVTVRPDWIFRANGSAAQGPHYYKVQFVQEMHTGFPNQYYALYCLQCNANGTIPKIPFPT
jgi:hypothetical protein